MNNELKRDFRKLTLNYFGLRYSPYFPLVVSLGLILISIIMFSFFVIPQLDNWFSINKEVENTQGRIRIIGDNISYLQQSDKAILDKQFDTSVRALPVEKDFAGILNTISSSAIESGTQLQDFQFSLSEVSLNTLKENKNSALPIDVSFSISGGIDGVSTFISSIEESIPLTQVKSLEYGNNSAKVTISFYVKELPELEVKDDEPIIRLNQKQLELLSRLEEWDR